MSRSGTIILLGVVGAAAIFALVQFGVEARDAEATSTPTEESNSRDDDVVAATACLPEYRVATAKGNAVKDHSSRIKSESELYPLQGDKVVVVLEKRSVYSPELGFSDDYEGPKIMPLAKFEPGVTSRSNDAYDVRVRRATVGDLRHRDLMSERNSADRALDECIKRTCKRQIEGVAAAKRLYELHNSEATARELVAAEKAKEGCERLPRSP